MKQFKNNQMKFVKSIQHGFSLIELMVAMTIGVFLIGGVLTNFIGTKDSDRLRRAVSEMDENARVAFDILRRSIAHAGYPSLNNTPFDEPFYTSFSGASVLENKACGGTAEGGRYDSGGAPSADRFTKDGGVLGDIISVGFLADNPCKGGLDSCADIVDVSPSAKVYTDCTGGGLTRESYTVSCSTDPTVGMSEASDARVYSTFYLKKEDPDGDIFKKSLVCGGTRGGAQSIISNVFSMQALYGVTIDNAGIPETQYFKATDITSADWKNVTSVRIGLLLRSENKALLSEDGASNIVLLNESISIPPDERRRLYRTYTTTVSLLNRNQGVIR